MATTTATDQFARRYESAVVDALRKFAACECRLLTLSEQERHIDRTVIVQHTLAGDGWAGISVLLLPMETAQALSLRMDGARSRPKDIPNSRVIGEALAALGAGVGMEFGRRFCGEDAMTIGMPTVVHGTDVGVGFPWAGPFECRHAFTTEHGPLWGILRLTLSPARM